MAFHRWLSATLFLAINIANLAEALTNKDGILEDLGIDTNIVFDNIEITFDDSTKVQFGNTLDLANVKVQPNVTVDDLKGTKFQTLAMVDPDAPSRKNPVAAVRLHFQIR